MHCLSHHRGVTQRMEVGSPHLSLQCMGFVVPIIRFHIPQCRDKFGDFMVDNFPLMYPFKSKIVEIQKKNSCLYTVLFRILPDEVISGKKEIANFQKVGPQQPYLIFLPAYYEKGVFGTLLQLQIFITQIKTPHKTILLFPKW